MKRRATAILLGIMVSSMFLSACGKNEAKEAANESAQVEEEGVGEVTEEGEKVEAENKNASDADDSSKAGDSAKSDEDNKETSVKEEEDGDSSGKDSDDESEEDAASAFPAGRAPSGCWKSWSGSWPDREKMGTSTCC